MRIEVKVIPKSSKSQLIPIDDHHFKAYLHSPPEKGKANQELLSLISHWFQVPKGSISLVKGKQSKRKIIEIQMKNR